MTKWDDTAEDPIECLSAAEKIIARQEIPRLGAVDIVAMSVEEMVERIKGCVQQAFRCVRVTDVGQAEEAWMEEVIESVTRGEWTGVASARRSESGRSVVLQLDKPLECGFINYDGLRGILEEEAPDDTK